MTELYKNKYRIPSARLQTWDYGDNGLYFVTICTASKEYFFGEIVETQCFASPDDRPDDIMQLNDLGKIVEEEWLKTPQLRSDMNLELNEYVVMPNHFHAIIYIGDNAYNNHYERYPMYHGDLSPVDAKHCVSTPDIYNATFSAKNKFGPQYKNLASTIRGFKSAVTNYARKNDIPFNWQSRFHDHIITSNDEYLRIADYINDNPTKWQEDKFYIK